MSPHGTVAMKLLALSLILKQAGSPTLHDHMRNKQAPTDSNCKHEEGNPCRCTTGNTLSLQFTASLA